MIIGGISATTGRLNTDDPVNNETRTKLSKMWEHCDRHYLAIDVISMISNDFFVLLARNITIGIGDMDNRSFGGISVILLGDFHQFPPVATGKTST